MKKMLEKVARNKSRSSTVFVAAYLLAILAGTAVYILVTHKASGASWAMVLGGLGGFLVAIVIMYVVTLSWGGFEKKCLQAPGR